MSHMSPRGKNSHDIFFVLLYLILWQPQCSSRKISIAEDELEPVHKPLRYRRFRRTKRHPRANGEFEELTDKNGNGNGVALPKKGGKHSVQKKIDRLVEENRILTMKLESSNINPGKFLLIYLKYK